MDCTRQREHATVVELHGGLDRTICLAVRRPGHPSGDRLGIARGQPDLRRARRAPSTPMATPSWPMRTSTASSWCHVRYAVRGRSSRMWCSSARRCRAKGWSAATSSFRARERCSCSARRWRSCRVTGLSCARPSFRYRSRSSTRARPARMGVRASASIRRLARSCRRWRLSTCAGGWDHERHVAVRFDGPYGGRHRRDAWAGPSFRPRPGRGRRGHRRRRAR